MNKNNTNEYKNRNINAQICFLYPTSYRISYPPKTISILFCNSIFFFGKKKQLYDNNIHNTGKRNNKMKEKFNEQISKQMNNNTKDKFHLKTLKTHTHHTHKSFTQNGIKWKGERKNYEIYFNSHSNANTPALSCQKKNRKKKKKLKEAKYKTQQKEKKAENVYSYWTCLYFTTYNYGADKKKMWRCRAFKESYFILFYFNFFFAMGV